MPSEARGRDGGAADYLSQVHWGLSTASYPTRIRLWWGAGSRR